MSQHQDDRTTNPSEQRPGPDRLSEYDLAARHYGRGTHRRADDQADKPDEPDGIDLDLSAGGDRANSTKRHKTLNSRLVSLGTGGLLGTAAAVLIIVFVMIPWKNGPAETNETTATPPGPDSETATTSAAAPSTTAFAPPATGPWVLISYDAGLRLSGTVPDEATSSAVLAAAEPYAPNVASDLQVDPAQPAAEWLAAAPDVVPLLSLAINGDALIADGKVRLSLRAPTEQAADRIERAISDATGLTVTTEQADITGQAAPVLEVSGTVSQLQLTGRVPTEEVQQATLDAAAEVYGGGNVISQITVDDSVHTAFWMHDPQGLFEDLFVYPEIELAIEGETTTGFVRGGYSFSSGSADAVPTSDGVIGFAVDLMNRDPSLIMVIQAHTDPDGPDDTNQALSQQRADTVAAYYTDNGIDPARITAVGKAATELLTEDTTPQGKDRNRRIDVVFSTT